MATSNATRIGGAFSSSSRGAGAFLDRWAAAEFLEAVIAELRTALDAGAEHQDLVRRSARQLTRMGLDQASISTHIRNRYYAG